MVHAVVLLFSGCFDEIMIFEDEQDAKKEYEHQIIDRAGWKSVEEYEEALNGAEITKMEPHLIETELIKHGT